VSQEALVHAHAAPSVDSGRTRFGATIVVSHALKHLYISSLPSVLLPEIKIAMGLSAAQVGAMASVQQFTGWFSTMGSGYIGDRFVNRTGFMLSLSIGLTGVSYFFLGIADSYALLLGAMLLVGFGPSLFHPPAFRAASPTGAPSPSRCTGRAAASARCSAR
jgi:sugar phosphate permease